MPTFPFTDEERADIVAYFRAVDGIDSPFDQPIATLDAKLVAAGEARFNSKSEGCRGCHPWKGSRGEGIDPKVNEGPDLGNVWKRFRPEGTREWIKKPQYIAGEKPGVNMPPIYFEYVPRTDRFEPGLGTIEESQHAVDAISEFLMSQGGARQVSINP
jgi:hypothetical protein